MGNLIKTPGFETDIWHKVDQFGTMTVPEGWQAFYLHKPGKHQVPWDPNNESGISSPEFKPVDAKPPYLDPPRVHSGQWAACWLGTWKVIDAGLYQQVQVSPAQKLRLSAWAHGWSNSGDQAASSDHAHDPKWSDGKDVGYNAFFQLADPAWPSKGNSALDDAGRNMVFQVGIDPTGGTDAFSSSVIWGPAAHIYNVYQQVPPVEITADGNTVTIFLRTRNLWGLMHNDAYWDDPVLEVVGETQPEPVPQPGPQPSPLPPRPVPEPLPRPQPEPSPQPSPQPLPTTLSALSKLGAHVLSMNDDTAKFIAAGPGVVKFAGDWGYAPAVPQGTFVIGRKVLSTDDDAQQIRARGLSPQQGVHNFIFGKENQIQTYQSNPAIKYWEGHNEPVWGDEDGMKWYADFEIERMQQMEKLGLKCVIGNFATGTPLENLWPAFLPAVQAAAQYGAILGLHEYGCPWMWWMTGRYQVEDENCVDPRDPNRIEGWTILRYRRVYRQFLEPAGLGNVPLVITEFGLDPGVGPTPKGCPGGAWRNLGGYWRQHRDDAAFDYKAAKYPPPADVQPYANGAQFYAEQLKWIDREMRKDPYVIGATIFTFGSFGGVWAAFDVTGDNGCAPLLTEYILQLKAAPPPPPTPPPTPPVSQPETLTVQPAVIPHDGLKVRVAHNVEADFVEALPAGVKVTVLEGPITDGGETWLRVRTASGNEGWVRPRGDGEVYLA